MAYIESHQDLRTHPKVKRLARLLDIPKAQAIGHLQMLWWWALDHAFDGSCRSYDAFDLADAAEWGGDPDSFVKALMECGPGDEVGFLDPDWTLHAWRKYTEALVASRAGSALGNHKRWHESRGVINPDCPHCVAPDVAPDVGPEIPPDSPPTSPPNPKPSGGDSTYRPTDLPTQQPLGGADALATDAGMPTKATDGQTYSRTLGEWAEEYEPPPEGADRNEATRWLVRVIEKHAPRHDIDLQAARGLASKVIVDYLTATTDTESPPQVWALLGRLVKTSGAGPILDCLITAVEAGAGLDPKYADDPLALLRYATAVKNGKGRK